jgi:pyruvyl transferase EpsI
MYSECPITKENRDECVRKKMQEFCGAKLVITDRLHGMVFSAITGTPCIVFSNSNHKVKGTYDWISYLPYISYVDTAEQAKEAITKLLDMKDCFYDNEPLKPYFENLAKVVMKNVNGK